jgi:two-component system phosphate regulon sensor histidine kinase PhoR
MKLGLRAKLFLASIAMILVSMVPADLYLSSAVDSLITQRLKDDLTARLSLASSIAANGPADLNDPLAWNAFAHEVGSRAGARVSIIRADGVLIGDSALDAAALARAENHRSREEVAAALAGTSGSSARLSGTVGVRMMYAAEPLRRDGKIVGAVRLALPLTQFDALRDRIHGMLAWATALALIVAVAVSLLTSSRVARDASSLAGAARRMAGGDLSTRTNPSGSDEFAELGRALDRLAANLSSTLHELRSERDLLGGILASMQEGVMLLNEADRVALVNPALREMLLLGNDAVGRSLPEIVHDPELATVLEKGRTNSATAIGEIELAGLKPRRLLVRALAMAGEPGGLLAVFVDVTELRRLEKLRRDFVANVSHELRTPVTAIRSATETLQESAKNDPAAVPLFVDIIARNAERMRQLVEDLLDLSKIESREYQLDLEPIDLRQAVPQAFALFRERADKKRIELVCDVPEVVPAVRVDRKALEQVLSNLLENAIKYCAEASSIRVWADVERERFVKLAVEDTGPGIEAKHLPRLFERFYRVDKGRARDVGGTGLGLSIVKHLVEAMGGEVGVDSTVGKGSTFWALLPRASAPSIPPRSPREGQSSASETLSHVA